MLKIETNEHIVSHLEARGTADTVCSEITLAISLLYAKLLDTNPDMAAEFRRFVLDGMCGGTLNQVLDKRMIGMLVSSLKNSESPLERDMFDNIIADVTAG